MSPRPALARLLAHREPALLLSGQTISQFGDGVATVAFTLLILDRTHSISALAWFSAARMAPLVAFLLFGGATVDRHSRRLLMLASDSGRALLTGGIVALLLAHALTMGDLLAFAVAFGTFDALFMPSFTALTPEIVPAELLPAMNAVRPFTSQVMGNMIGPAVGGLLAAVSTTAAIAVDCATFVISAGALALMRPTPRPDRPQPQTMLREIAAGWRYVRHTTWLWRSLLAVTIGNALLFTPMGVLISFALRHQMHVSKSVVGYYFAVSGAAGALSSLAATSLPTPRRRVRAMWLAWLAAGLSGFLLAGATHPWELFVVPVIATPGILIGNIIWESMLQVEVPRDLLGRVSSVDWFVSLGLSPVGVAVAGAVSARVGVAAYALVATVVTLVPGLMVIASPRVHAVDTHPRPATVTPEA